MAFPEAVADDFGYVPGVVQLTQGAKARRILPHICCGGCDAFGELRRLIRVRDVPMLARSR